MNLLVWLQTTNVGKFVLTLLVSIIPITELRVGLPFGVSLGLPYWQAFTAAVIGNILPAPFIIWYIRRILQWLRRNFPRLDGFVSALERKAHLKGRKVRKYKYLGLLLFVGIPLPGTGVWTGSLVAAFLDMPRRQAIPSIVAGVVLAGLIIIGLTHVGINLFSAVMA